MDELEAYIAELRRQRDKLKEPTQKELVKAARLVRKTKKKGWRELEDESRLLEERIAHLVPYLSQKLLSIEERLKPKEDPIAAILGRLQKLEEARGLSEAGVRRVVRDTLQEPGGETPSGSDPLQRFSALVQEDGVRLRNLEDSFRASLEALRTDVARWTSDLQRKFQEEVQRTRTDLEGLKERQVHAEAQLLIYRDEWETKKWGIDRLLDFATSRMERQEKEFRDTLRSLETRFQNLEIRSPPARIEELERKLERNLQALAETDSRIIEEVKRIQEARPVPKGPAGPEVG